MFNPWFNAPILVNPFAHAFSQVNRSLPDTTSFPPRRQRSHHHFYATPPPASTERLILTCVYREALADEAAVQYGGFCIVSLVNDEELRPVPMENEGPPHHETCGGWFVLPNLPWEDSMLVYGL